MSSRTSVAVSTYLSQRLKSKENVFPFHAQPTMLVYGVAVCDSRVPSDHWWCHGLSTMVVLMTFWPRDARSRPYLSISFQCPSDQSLTP
ncbi:hypothetical protein SALBM311S_05070 [Streptomyces alboniger]